MNTERKINRIPEGDLPALPDGWRWVGAMAIAGAPCWDVVDPHGCSVWMHSAEWIEAERGTVPLAIVALVKYANGLGPDPFATTPPTRDNRALAIALLAASMDDNEDPRIEAAIALLENA